MDSLTPEKRAWVMSRVKGRDTKPEKAVRSMLHRLGYRFRLRRSDLPGCPDIVLPKYKSVIFVHGCYWHRHDCPNGRRLPRSRLDFWKPKLEGNRKRDLRHYKALDNQGWKVLIIWECMLKDKPLLLKTIQGFLKPKGSP
jgi:DNA mismatch endonuclease (patch repair protein)